MELGFCALHRAIMNAAIHLFIHCYQALDLLLQEESFLLYSRDMLICCMWYCSSLRTVICMGALQSSHLQRGEMNAL